MIEITCPSGLKGTLRGMKVKDEQLFANRKLVKSGKVLSRLIDTCWIETQDPGPYTFDGKPDWDNVLASDRTFILIQLRIASYGADYTFSVTCQACKHKYGWGVNLHDMDVTPVSDAGRRHVRTGELITVNLPDSRQVQCRLLTGQDDVFFAGMSTQDEDKILTWNLARRVAEIDGKREWQDVLPAIEDMEVAVGDFLWDATDELEGGVETSFDVECPVSSCSHEQQVILPFEAGFFSKRKRFTRSKAKKDG